MTGTKQDHAADDLPVRYQLMLEDALCTVRPEFREELGIVASVVSLAAWRGWLAECGPEDNRQEHEWVVFANVMRIAEKENLDLAERRIATAFAFMHDSHRITDRLLEAEEPSADAKAKQRREHMVCGARIARSLLPSLLRPDGTNRRLFEDYDDVNRCAEIIRKHDSWKLDPPRPFDTGETLAVVCVEADALWPLHPLGVLADIERANEKLVKDPAKYGAVGSFASPWSWEAKLKDSLATLTHRYRGGWEVHGIPASDFKDRESIFRTEEGYRLYREWRIRWNV